MKRNFKLLLAAAICSCSLSMVSYAGSWQAEGDSWKYLNDDASYAAGGWISDNGKWYYFDENGYMKTGWVLDRDNWYYLNSTGEMRQEPLVENQITYYFDAASGVCTNPYAARTSETGGLIWEEQHYKVQIEWFALELERVGTESASKLDNLDVQDVQGSIDLLEDMKAPFVQVYQLDAPARFAPAHEHFRSGCKAMIEYLDFCIEIIKTGSLSTDQFLELNEKANSVYDVVTSEFSTATELYEDAL